MASSAKLAADIITIIRTLLIPVFIWLGFAYGTDALPVVIWLEIFNWTADSLDGPLARRSSIETHTWIGDRDLPIDMLITAALGVYLVGAGLLGWQILVIYLLLWLLVFWRLGLTQILGIIYQIPIYVLFLFYAFRDVPQSILWLVGWALAAMVVTWPKFPKVIVPDFINGIKQLFTKNSPS